MKLSRSKLLREERGQTSLEYALIIAAAVVLAGVLAYTVKSLLKAAPKQPLETGAQKIAQQLQ